jgi:hypothetical protein
MVMDKFITRTLYPQPTLAVSSKWLNTTVTSSKARGKEKAR